MRRKGIAALQHVVAGHLVTHRSGIGENVHQSGKSIHQSEDSGEIIHQVRL
jgi:hypothetical protein